MTDDEAFIRAIVDAPGDDAPRLIYGDWLDERGDPRGAYLRATVEWGCRLHDVETREKAERQLRNASRSLDPVWVCRVTTPPIGICCLRVRLLDCGTQISPGRINDLENRLQISLPSEYRAFLLNYNGGIPEPDVFQIGHSQFSRLQAFFSVGEWLTNLSGGTPGDHLETFAERLNSASGRVAMFPVAAIVELHQADEDLDDMIERATLRPWSSDNWETCLCIDLGSEEIIRAYIDLSPNALHNRVPFSVEPVAKSLAVLLNQLDELPAGWEPEGW